ncbi:Cysteine protease RD19A [Vitis vinifera]|uniref:Cysteine protease RD19A n=1 Tax=Vitis vinifera TaxID=29760 RepID=A0A438I992_VITVI|nr:Cysteine protease RD19A [Vitis vinifera]
MARSFSLLFFLLFSLFFVALTSSELHSGGSDDDIIIRQVVPELGDVEGSEEENLLTADHHHFSIFKRRFGKSYASQEEHDYRFKVFKANLRRARRHQQLDPSATHGVTQFSDLTPAEFRGTYLGLRPLKLPHDAQKAPILPTNDLPEDFDWRDHGAVTAVKNQGSCGSCWSFSTTGALEGANFLATGNLVSLSEQQLVECDHEMMGKTCTSWARGWGGDVGGSEFALQPGPKLLKGNYDGDEYNIVLMEVEFRNVVMGSSVCGGYHGNCDPEEMGSCDSGCNGGLMNTAFEYTLKAGGLMKEEDYPYTGTDRGSCKFDKTKIAASVSNFSVISLDEDQIAANLVKNGPLAVAINAVFMQTYVGGVSCPYICSKRLDHGVLLVGYGSAGYAPIRMKDKPYWIIKNSWGENWGENGFYKICRGRNVCGVDSMVSTVAAVHTTSN